MRGRRRDYLVGDLVDGGRGGGGGGGRALFNELEIYRSLSAVRARAAVRSLIWKGETVAAASGQVDYKSLSTGLQ